MHISHPILSLSVAVVVRDPTLSPPLPPSSVGRRCSHCRHFAPKYVRVATEINVSHPDVQFHAVSCVAHNTLCNDQNVTGYPTIRVYRGGSYEARKWTPGGGDDTAGGRLRLRELGLLESDDGSDMEGVGGGGGGGDGGGELAMSREGRTMSGGGGKLQKRVETNTSPPPPQNKDDQLTTQKKEHRQEDDEEEERDREYHEGGALPSQRRSRLVVGCGTVVRIHVTELHVRRERSPRS